MRNELVQRRVEQTDVHRQAVHSVQDTFEVGFLVRQQLSQRFLATLAVLGENHLTHRKNLLVVEEHVLGTGQTDTLSAELTSYASVVRSVGVGTNLEMRIFVAEVHECLEVTAELSSLGRDLTCIDLSG